MIKLYTLSKMKNTTSKLNEPKEKNEKTKNNNYININNKDNNSKVKKILITIIEIIFCVALIIIAYFIGMKVKEGRKKRANELKDESYEYISYDNIDINNKIVP